MNNTVIKVLNIEHGQKVKKYFLDKNIECKHFAFDNTAIYDNSFYYGIIDDCFGNYDLKYVKAKSVNIIELPEELHLPRMVEVRDKDGKWCRRRLVHILPCKYNKRYICESYFNSKNTINWIEMREIPKVEEMTLEQVCKELGKKIKIIK